MAEKRAYSQAQNRATQKWEKENIYKVSCKFPKSWEEHIKLRASEVANNSVSAYLKSLVENDIFSEVVDEPTHEQFIDAP